MATKNASADKAQKNLKKITNAQKKAAKAQVKADKLQRKADRTQKRIVQQGAFENMMIIAAMLGMIVLAVVAATTGTGSTEEAAKSAGNEAQR